MTRTSSRTPSTWHERGAAGVALRIARSRRMAGIIMAAGTAVSLVALVAALAFTTDGAALAIFIGVLLLSCLVSCLVAWRLSENAARDLADQVEELARRRANATDGVKPS